MSGGCDVSDLEELGFESNAFNDGAWSGEVEHHPQDSIHNLTSELKNGHSSCNGHHSSRPLCDGEGCSSGSCAGTNQQPKGDGMALGSGASGSCGAPSASCSPACNSHIVDANGMSANGVSARVTGDNLDGGGGSAETAARKGTTAAPLCAKCRVAPAEVIANQREPYCGACLRASLMYKVKTAINKHALVQAHDAVLLAFSGGHAST